MKQSPTISSHRRAMAQRLRHSETPAEKRLWKRLKTLLIHGSHFRRQVPIGAYIVDFACLSAKLIVEVDGSSHTTDQGIERDNSRTAWLENEGYRVLRFWNEEVQSNIEGVLETIYAALYGGLHIEPFSLKHYHPTPLLRSDPPPQGEGKK